MDTKPYKVLKPIAWNGTRQIGEIVHLTDEEAARIGDEYVALESEPVSTGGESPKEDSKVEDEAADKPEENA